MRSLSRFKALEGSAVSLRTCISESLSDHLDIVPSINANVIATQTFHPITCVLDPVPSKDSIFMAS